MGYAVKLYQTVVFGDFKKNSLIALNSVNWVPKFGSSGYIVEPDADLFVPDPNPKIPFEINP